MKEPQGGEPSPAWVRSQVEGKFAANKKTKGLLKAALEAERDWDKLMNDAYRSLIYLLSADQKREMVKVQQAWLSHRQKEFAFVNSAKNVSQEFRATYRMDFVKSRCLVLSSLYEEIEAHTP